MNSVLQCLSHTTPLREQLLMSQHLKGKLIQGTVLQYISNKYEKGTVPFGMTRNLH